MSSTTVPNPANGSFPSRSSRLSAGCDPNSGNLVLFFRTSKTMFCTSTPIRAPCGAKKIPSQKEVAHNALKSQIGWDGLDCILLQKILLLEHLTMLKTFPLKLVIMRRDVREKNFLSNLRRLCLFPDGT